MQESRRWRWLQLHLLPLIGVLGLGAAACATQPAARGPSSPEPAAAATTATPASADPAAPAPPLTSPSSEQLATTAPPAEQVTPADELPKGSRVLQVGDSFADALGGALAKLFKDSGVRTTVETKTPSYIGDWAFGKELRLILAKYNPDLVLVTLGANEVEIPTPEQRAGAVQRLVSSLGQRPCVWILPPLWKEDTGVMQVIRDNAAPCQVLDSRTLVPNLPRGPDRIHPNKEGRARWAAAVFDWLKAAREPNGPRPWSLRGGPL